jgi:hypothetical protein
LLRYLDQNAEIVLTLEGPDYRTYGFVEVWRFR